jgi:hypothetical protein
MAKKEIGVAGQDEIKYKSFGMLVRRTRPKVFLTPL